MFVEQFISHPSNVIFDKWRPSLRMLLPPPPSLSSSSSYSSPNSPFYPPFLLLIRLIDNKKKKFTHNSGDAVSLQPSIPPPHPPLHPSSSSPWPCICYCYLCSMCKRRWRMENTHSIIMCIGLVRGTLVLFTHHSLSHGSYTHTHTHSHPKIKLCTFYVFFYCTHWITNNGIGNRQPLRKPNGFILS